MAHPHSQLTLVCIAVQPCWLQPTFHPGSFVCQHVLRHGLAWPALYLAHTNAHMLKTCLAWLLATTSPYSCATQGKLQTCRGFLQVLLGGLLIRCSGDNGPASHDMPSVQILACSVPTWSPPSPRSNECHLGSGLTNLWSSLAWPVTTPVLHINSWLCCPK